MIDALKVGKFTMERRRSRDDLRDEVEKIVIQAPCQVGWDEMAGDDMIRFCGQCKKNVHNLSTLPDDRLAEVLAERKIKETCVIMSKDKNGRVRFDNCPVALRKVRDHYRKVAVSLLLIAAWSLALSADAQGLVGAPPVVCNGGGGGAEMGQMADFGYDTARDISRGITLCSLILVALWPVKKETRENLRKLALTVVARTCVPIFIHLAGTFAINNYGGSMGAGGL